MHTPRTTVYPALLVIFTVWEGTPLSWKARAARGVWGRGPSSGSGVSDGSGASGVSSDGVSGSGVSDAWATASRADSSMGDCRSVSTVARDSPSPGSQLPMVHCSSHLAALPPLSGTSLSAAAATVTNVAAASTSAAIRRSHCFISITSDKYMRGRGEVMTRGRGSFALRNKDGLRRPTFPSSWKSGQKSRKKPMVSSLPCALCVVQNRNCLPHVYIKFPFPFR